jgi:two-component system, chemotaxis family, sensor kinase CheA
MPSKEDEFYQRLLGTFKIEAEEHLQTISDGLLALEKVEGLVDQTAIIETIFREIHSLKGAARAVNLREIETICQPLESLLALWKKNSRSPTPELFDLVYRTLTVLEEMVSMSQTGFSAAHISQVNDLVKQLAEAVAGSKETPSPAAFSQSVGPDLQSQVSAVPAADQIMPGESPDANSSGIQETPKFREKPGLTDTVRVATGKLDALLLQAEELIAAKLIAGQRAADLRDSFSEFDSWYQDWAKVQPQFRLAGQLLAQTGEGREAEGVFPATTKLLDFLEVNANFIKNLETKLAPLVKAAEHDHRVIGGLVDSLLENMKKVLMLPFSVLLEPFPKFVRDLAREQGKEVDLIIEGGKVEIDRRILQEIKDPLMHLVRNSIDHGLETPEARVRKNKSPRGRILITIAQKDSSKVEICVADNGAGIDPEKVKAAAIKNGYLTSDEAANLSEAEARRVIFRSGISTSPIITNISGRGLGLPIVQEKVEKLGGALLLEASPETGTSFRLILPLTLATFRGTLIQIGNRTFVIPTANLERVARVKQEEVKTVENRETIPLNGKSVALASLAAILDLPTAEPGSKQRDFLTVLVLSAGDRRVAFSVDGVLNEQEVLVKNLGKQLSRVPNIAGATVLGSGKVVPILNVADLLKSAVKSNVGSGPLARAQKNNGEQTKSILVAEDSITARTLLKNILELAGYQVKTAVDGVEGFTALQKGNFDLVVSDVEMPRMSGFDLTSKIRADKRLSDLPVVLVTALESTEDRKRGIDVGANAYLVKSSFDQGNLLELIHRLI